MNLVPMEPAIHVLLDHRGGANRARILYTLNERPRNAHKLASALDLNDETVNHHLSILLDEELVRKSGGHYGAVYLLTDRTHHH